jgi:hypothetical protein
LMDIQPRNQRRIAYADGEPERADVQALNHL